MLSIPPGPEFCHLVKSKEMDNHFHPSLYYREEKHFHGQCTFILDPHNEQK